jgi:hypothetical protein
MTSDDMPLDVKLCECGCGEPAPISNWTDRRNGRVKGQPGRFIRGHSARVMPPPQKKPKLFVEVGQRIGRGVVLEAKVPFIQPSGRVLRGAKLRCDCGNEYVARIDDLVGKQASTPHGAKSCGCLNAEQRLAAMARAAEARRGKHNIGFIDRTGHRYGLLTVIGLAESPTSRKSGFRYYWLCECDCGSGKLVTAEGASLVGGKTRSCGCLRQRPRLPEGQSAARNTVLRSYKKSAESRGHAWELSEEDFDRLTSMDCYYCGSPPSTVRATASGRGSFIYNGIDRVDNKFGYLSQNVVSACKTCNIAKGTMSFDGFMEWIGRLVAHSWFRPEHVPSAAIKPALRVVQDGETA